MYKILVVDDEELFADQLVAAVSGEGREVFKAVRADHAIQLIREEQFSLVITDFQLFKGVVGPTGIDILKAAKEKDLYTQVIIVTAFGTAEIGVDAMSKGAFDYIESNAPGINFLDMVKRKATLALEFRNAKLQSKVAL